MSLIFDLFKQFSGCALWGWLGGRTFVFITAVLSLGFYLENHARLTTQFVALVSILAGLFTARAVLDDHINGAPNAGKES